MKIKVVGIIICTLLIAFATPSVGIMIKNYNIKNIGNSEGVVRQIPIDPNDPNADCYVSCSETLFYIVYEDFYDISHPISTVHWWGIFLYYNWDDGKFYNCDHEGIIFDIVFYENDMGKPGNELCYFANVSPTILETGVKYKFPGIAPVWDLYYFKYDLNPTFTISEGWISIRNSNSPNNCSFAWMVSPDGNGRALINHHGGPWFDCPDFALMLSDQEEANLEIGIKGGFGSTIEITNTGQGTLNNIDVDIMVFGGIFRLINIHIKEIISELEPGKKTSLKTGIFLGFGEIAIGVIADDVVNYHDGTQLFMLTIMGGNR